MQIDTANARFSQDCTAAIAAADSHCFQCLVRHLKGMYPTTLATLARAMNLRFIACDWHSTDRGWDRILVTQPFPHIVDGDWRYTAPTAAKLVDLAHRFSGRTGTYLHIGSPSTYKAALAGRPSLGTHVLYDRNALLHDEAAVVDLCRASDADVALLDPPWYEEESTAFLAQAARHVRRGGLVLLAQPGAMTRPGVYSERAILLDAAAALGLKHIATLNGFTRYETPHFEHITLQRTLGVRVPADWRTGDLMVFQDSGEHVASARRPPPEDVRADDWRETTLGPVRIKYRVVPGVPTFGRLVPTDTPTSVSRRDPLRSRIGIWTSGNRVFGCDDGDVLAASLVRLRALMSPSALTPASVSSALILGGVEQKLADQAAYSIIDDVMEHLRYG